MQSLRDNIVNQSQSTDPNWNTLRDLIGQYLFTLQEFYSNTNWVEMFGDRVCVELGQYRLVLNFYLVWTICLLGNAVVEPSSCVYKCYLDHTPCRYLIIFSSVLESDRRRTKYTCHQNHRKAQSMDFDK